MSVIAEISIFPMDKGISVSQYVAAALKVIRESGLPYQLNSMGTCVEGEWEDVMAVVGKCFREIEKDSERIYLTLKADYRKGVSERLKGKVASVEEKL